MVTSKYIIRGNQSFIETLKGIWSKMKKKNIRSSNILKSNNYITKKDLRIIIYGRGRRTLIGNKQSNRSTIIFLLQVPHLLCLPSTSFPLTRVDRVWILITTRVNSPSASFLYYPIFTLSQSFLFWWQKFSHCFIFFFFPF